MLLFIILGVAAAIALITYTILVQMDERSVVRSSLRQLDGYEVENIRDQDLLRPFAERALVPFVGGLTGIGRRFTPVGYVDGIRKKFIYAGRGTAESVDRFLAIRVVTVALVPLWFLFVFVGGVGQGLMQLLLFGLGALVLVLGPDALLSRLAPSEWSWHLRPLRIVRYFFSMNIALFLGWYDYMRGSCQGFWEPIRRVEASKSGDPIKVVNG